MRRFILLAGLLAFTLGAKAQGVLFPDVGGATVRVPVTTLKQTRLAGTVLQQYDFSCGSAALATLLTHHYARPVSEQEVMQEMYAGGNPEKIQREGFSMLDMKRYLEGLGYAADGFEQPLEKLSEARIPAVVLINEAGYHHFVVIKGFDGRRVLVADPAKGTRAMPRREFESIWVGKLLFVIHNRMNEARFNARADWQAVPRAPLFAGRALEGAAILPKLGPGDF